MQSADLKDKPSDPSDAEFRQVADDQAGTTMDNLQVEDLDRPTTHEGDYLPENQVADPTGSSQRSPVMKKQDVPTATSKTNGNAMVKKILNTGPSGSSSVRQKVIGGGAIKSSAPALKKATTSSPTLTSKPALASSTSSKPTTSATHPTRRISVVPAKANAPGLSKQSVSASASMKPSEDPILRASPTGSVGTRSPIVTPALGRPRASVSETVRKPPASRPSMASSAKSPGPGKASTVARSSAAPTKPSRPSGSILSIKEVKDGGTSGPTSGEKINELKGQLEEANKSLESRTTAVTNLEGRIAQLEESLASANAELVSKTSSASKLEDAKITADSLLIAAQEALNKAQEELAEVRSTIESITKELSTAKLNTLAQDETIRSLQTQKNELEAANASHKEKVTHLEANHAKVVAAMTEVASVERHAHLKSQAELSLRTKDNEAQVAAHAEVVRELEARRAELKEKNETTATLQARLTTLISEKEENASKVSELEVEILELKETQEGLEDAQGVLQSRVDELLLKLSDADAGASVAADAAGKKDAEHSQKLKELSFKHEQELEASAVRVAEITTSLNKLKAEYVEVVGDLEKTKKDIVSKEEEHNLKFGQVEKAHADLLAALSSQLEDVSRNLNEQKSIYEMKVTALNAEHTKLLEEAFERAKSKAADAHGLELQELRSNSNSTIKQLQEANQNSLEELKAEHASTFEIEVGSLNKHINKLNLELKATKDDLAKAKISLETSRREIESLTQQRNDARAQADASPAIDPKQAEEVSRLEEELESLKDDLAKSTNLLTLTKSTMAELSDKHVEELESAAKGRADEVLQLRAVHDAEVTDLATQKAELLIKLSDMEGELATAKAALTAHEAASPKVNGTSHPSSPGVSREELQKLHEAHNLKIHDMQADHDKTLRLAKEELETATKKIDDLQQDLSRKVMEIQYLEQEEEESQEHITRLKADLESLSEKSQPA